MKKVINNSVSILKGVSTLDATLKALKCILLLLISIIALGGAARAGHSTLDVVDPSFNPQIQTSVVECGGIRQIITLPNGKMLVAGAFNTYNGQPVGAIVRLNSDGTLDTTFTSNLPRNVEQMILQSDGKILVLTYDYYTEYYYLFRLNADGTGDPSFRVNYVSQEYLWSIGLDANDRIILHGSFPIIR